MKNVLHLASRALLFGAVAFSVGCANQLEQRVSVSTEFDRTLLNEAIDIDIDAPSPTSQWELGVKHNQTYSVVQSEKTDTYEVYTPYQAARELYELPLGVIALAGGVTINVVDVALLGMIPDRLTNGPLNVAFAGMNPFMNIESESRSESELLSSDLRELDTKQEHTSMPLRNAEIQAVAAGTTFPVVLDENGEARVGLLDVALKVGAGFDEITFKAEAGNTAAERTEMIPQVAAFRLDMARSVLEKYRAMGSDIDIVEAAADIHLLSTNGFETQSRSLRDSLRASLDAEHYSQLMSEVKSRFM